MLKRIRFLLGAGMMLPLRFAACAVLLVSSDGVIRGEGVWDQFRGPSGNGVAAGPAIVTDFGEDSAVTWKTPVPGRAWSSPLVVDGLIWVTTAIEQEPSEEERAELLKKKGVKKKKEKQSALAVKVELLLMAFDLETGSQVKSLSLVTVDEPDSIHSLNSFASPTPAADGSRLFCHFGTFGTFCVERESGNVVWQRRLSLEHGVGPGSSPLVYDEHLVLIQDGMDRQYVTALNKKTGKTVWETERPEMDTDNGDIKKSYCTPVVATDSLGREQLICMGARWMVAYDPKSGAEIWRVRHGDGFSVVPRPVVAGDVVYFCTGFGKPNLVAVRIDGSGDVSDSHVLWIAKSGIPKKPSPILSDGLIYLVADNGVAICINATDGSTVWKERLGGDYSASPILVGGLIYFASQDGKVTVMKTGDEADIVAVNEMDGKIMASPAVVDGALVLRTDQALYRIED